MAEISSDSRRPLFCPVCSAATPLTHACTVGHNLNIFICEDCGSTLSVPNLSDNDLAHFKRTQ